MDEETRQSIRRAALVRLKLLEELVGRDEVSRAFPAHCAAVDLLAWRKHFTQPPGPKGSEHWRRSRVQPTIPQLSERRIADEVREWDDYLNDLEPRAEDVPITDGGTRPNDPRDRYYSERDEADESRTHTRTRKRSDVKSAELTTLKTCSS